MKTFIKASFINSKNELSPKCEVVHETKLTSEISCVVNTAVAIAIL